MSSHYSFYSCGTTPIPNQCKTVGYIFRSSNQNNCPCASLQGNDPVIPPKEGRLNIYNGFDCNVTLHSPLLRVDNLGALGMVNVNYSPMSQIKIVEIGLNFDQACTIINDNIILNTTVTVAEGKVIYTCVKTTNPENYVWPL